MKFAFASLLLVVAVAQCQNVPLDRVMIPDNIKLNSDEMIQFINSIQTTWTVSLFKLCGFFLNIK